MTARLPIATARGKDGLRRDPTSALHRRHSLAWRDLLYGLSAQLSRLTGIPERELQRWAEPQSERESPSERMARVFRAAREMGEGDRLQPLEELVREFMESSEPATAAGMNARMGCLSIEFGELQQYHGEATSDGEIDAAEARRNVKEAKDLRAAVDDYIRDCESIIRADEESRHLRVAGAR